MLTEVNYVDGGGGQSAHGSFSSNGENTVPLDFEPSYLYVYKLTNSSGTISNGDLVVVYDKDKDASNQYQIYKSSGTLGANVLTLPNSSNNCIQSISSSGFTFKTSGAFVGTYYYMAIE